MKKLNSSLLLFGKIPGQKVRVPPGRYATAWDDAQCSRAMHQGRGHLCYYLRECILDRLYVCVHTLATREPALSAKTSLSRVSEILVNLTSVTLLAVQFSRDETTVSFLLVLALPANVSLQVRSIKKRL
ncbi:hypothetical protein WN51_02137 [Melipona quadrifasciata]|uniref:Uncharacterized protein n=1 Tax=Melipona quadrifasciata TaxID=166423 RepID=A0A0M8ZVZ3_9HYME|nr:hypothetical protein WN51_02137 [Melipona quadrifasciata]